MGSTLRKAYLGHNGEIVIDAEGQGEAVGVILQHLGGVHVADFRLPVHLNGLGRGGGGGAVGRLAPTPRLPLLAGCREAGR